MNRLGLKIICLMASIVIWIQVAATSTSVQSVNLPVQVVGLADNLTVAGNNLPRRISVRMEGSKLMLLAHKYFNRNMGEVRLNLSGMGPDQNRSYDVQRQDVFSDATALVVQPQVILDLVIDRQVERKLPVELKVEGSLSADLGFLQPPSIMPDSVLVSGPERFFQPDSRVQTSVLDLGQVTERTEYSVSLAAPNDFLTLGQGKGRVVVPVARLEDRTIANLPVIPLVDAGRPEVGVSPPTVDVMVRGVADSVRALTRARFSVTVPVGDLAEGVYALPGQVEYPLWLTIIGLDPPEFTVIVGNPRVQTTLPAGAVPEADTVSAETGETLD